MGGAGSRLSLTGHPDATPSAKAAITTVTMTFFATLGFFVQQRLIDHYAQTTSISPEIHKRAQEIKKLEIAAIAEAGAAQSRADAQDRRRESR